jgi:outer membrane receptor protein involved in Fe transport
MRIELVALAVCLSVVGLSAANHVSAAEARGGQGGTALSQPDPGSVSNQLDEGQLAEVIVTAQKRQENIQDVPISIVAIDSNEIRKLNITSVDDLGLLVPGLVVQDDGTQRRITLRGVGNLSPQDYGSMVGVYLDDADVTSTGSAQLNLGTYDLQRVEVLRGPQGTLYGDGSMGGTVRFITNSPVLDAFQMQADVASMWTVDGSPSQRIQSVVNIPLVTDTLAIRIAGQFNHDGGWMDQPAASLKDINYQDTTDARAELLWQPTGQLAVQLTKEFHRSTGVPDLGEDANGNFTFPLDIPLQNQTTERFDLDNLRIKYDFASTTLTNSATYFYQSSYATNIGNDFYFDGPPQTTPPEVSYDAWKLQTENGYSDELRLSSNSSGPWQYTVGAFYRKFSYTNYDDAGYFGIPTPGMVLPPVGSDAFSHAFGPVSKSWSIYVDTSYKLADRLTLGVGARFYHDDEQLVRTKRATQAGSFQSSDPRFYADFKVNDQANIYLSAAKGFRSGGFNNALGFPPFQPEYVWTYELGTKLSLLDHRLTINADIFYSNYRNFVITGLNPNAIQEDIFQNAGDAVIKGAETQIQWRVADEWTLSLNADYIDAYFTSINLVPGSSAYNVGDNLDFTPKYQGVASVERDFKWLGRSTFARLDYQIQGQSTFRNRSIGPWYFSESDVIHMLNLAAGLDWNDNLRLGIFAQNLLNDRGFTTPIAIEQSADRARPLTIGVNFGVKF